MSLYKGLILTLNFWCTRSKSRRLLTEKTLVPVGREVLKDLSKTEYVFNTLLGSVASASTWDPVTIWVRSIRSIVNERARHRGGCTCE